MHTRVPLITTVGNSNTVAPTPNKTKHKATVPSRKAQPTATAPTRGAPQTGAATHLIKYTDSAGNTVGRTSGHYIHMGGKKAAIADLQAEFKDCPGICLPSAMSHQYGNVRFTVCDQATHPSHKLPDTKAHKLPTNHFTRAAQYFC
jgi:ribosome biogenesis GTPase A